ncbi:transposase [Paraburkholderia sp. WSM4179]|nr:transposase [Paraburkholderia sp. WSM4179]
MRYGRCQVGAAPPGSMGSNWRNCDACYCRARPGMALVPNYGRSSASVCSSSACMASSLAERRFGSCLGRWVSARKNPSGVRSSATSKLYATGSGTLGLRLKKAQREGRLIVFIDETGISERPTRVRTWALKGQTPVIQFHFNWNHVSANAGLSHTNYLFRLYEGSVRKEQVVEFLKALKAHLKQPLLIIWDGARPHRAAMVREYLDFLDGHIHMAFLPPYSPELNPVEYLWAWLKRHAIANFYSDNLNELQTISRNKLKSAQRQPSIIAACWIQATLW